VAVPALGSPEPDGQYLNRLANCAAFDVDAVYRFRGQLRDEVATRYPATLSP
jgi:hypothetical protein